MQRKNKICNTMHIQYLFIYFLWIFSLSLCTAQETDRRVIVLGFDGLDAGLVRQWMAEGKLPNLSSLASKGSFSALETSNPAESPVAWATFATGNNPGKHNIYDFLKRGKQSYQPRLGLAEVAWNPVLGGFWGKLIIAILVSAGIAFSCLVILRWSAGCRGFRSLFHVRRDFTSFIFLVLFAISIFVVMALLQNYLPQNMPWPVSLKKGESVWTVSSLNDVKTVVVAAPIAFPAEPIGKGRLLSGFGTPDMAGTNGLWFRYSTSWNTMSSTETGGWKMPLYEEKPRLWKGVIPGPKNLFVAEEKATLEKELSSTSDVKNLKRIHNRLAEIRKQANLASPFSVESTSREKLRITIGNECQEIASGGWSEWFTVPFYMNFLIQPAGMARVKVLGTNPPELYITPVQFHPLHIPYNVALSCPSHFASALALENGTYPTLGWAAATNPCKDEEIGDDVLWEDLQYIMAKREQMIFSEFAKKDWSLFMAFSYVPDRASHIYWRFLDPQHPRHGDNASPEIKNAILHVYQWVDKIVGKVYEEMREKDILIVLSDHGFAPFRWEVNINRWLKENGYLALKEDNFHARFQVADLYESHTLGTHCDWSRTKAYSMGLGKIYINLKGRDPEGIVTQEEYPKLCEEIREKLTSMRHNGEKVLERSYLRDEIYHGDCLAEAPDITLGFAYGYRISWQTTLGGVPPSIIEPNVLVWSGDHCSVDPTLIPGVLFCNRKVKEKSPNIKDIAPTILDLFGIPCKNMEGKALDLE